MVMFYALVALCFSSGALAQMVGWGMCPDVETVQDFNIRDIQGRWYELGTYISLGGFMLKCVTNDIRHGGGHGIMQMNTSAILRENGQIVSSSGIKLRVADVDAPGKLELQMPSSSDWSKYWILGSDANNWMVAYSCVDLELTHVKYIWILTRQQDPSGKIVQKAVKALKKQKLSGDFMYTLQENCDADSGSDESEEEDFKKAHILY